MPSRAPIRLAAAAGAALLFALPTATAAAADPQVYPLPGTVTAEAGLTTDAAGNVYFSVSDFSSATPRIGRLKLDEASTAAPAGFAFYPTPTYAGAPNLAILRSLDFDREKGLLWYSRSDGVYGYAAAPALVDGATAGASFARTPGGVNVQNVAVDQATHQVWLTEHGASNSTPAGQPAGYFPGNRIAVTAEGLGLTEGPNIAQQGGESTLVSSRYDAKPHSIVPDGSGGAWFTQANPGLPGYRIAHASGVSSYAEYPIQPCLAVNPCSGTYTGSGATGIAKGKDGAIWFLNEVNATVGRLDPTASTFTHYPLAAVDPSLSGSRPMAIRAAVDGTLWVATRGASALNTQANAVVRLVPSTTDATLTADVYKTGAAAPVSLAISASGDVWATANPLSGAGSLVRIGGAASPGGGTPGGGTPGGGTPAPPAAPAPGAIVVKPGVVGQAKIAPPKGDTVEVKQICVGPPQDKCSLVYLLDSKEYVTGFPGTKEALRLAAAPKAKTKKPKSKKPKTVELGRTELTLAGGQEATVKVRLSKKARTLLTKRKTLKATLRVMERQPDGTLKKISSKPLTFKAAKAGKKK